MCASVIYDAGLMVAGALIAGVVGLVTQHIQRKKEAVAGFRVAASEIAARPHLSSFHSESCAALFLALYRLRPFIPADRFVTCESILIEYQNIPEREMDRQSQDAARYKSRNHLSPEERFLSYLTRIENALG